MSNDAESGAPDQRKSLGCLLRMFWMMFGNFALGLAALRIIQSRSVLFSAWDAAYWLLVGAIIFSRYLDIRFAAGTTPSGQRATSRDLARHAIYLTAIAAVGWVLILVVKIVWLAPK